MNRALPLALLALAFMPAVKDFNHNPDARSPRAETSREAPAPSMLAQRCFSSGGRLRCF